MSQTLIESPPEKTDQEKFKVRNNWLLLLNRMPSICFVWKEQNWWRRTLVDCQPMNHWLAWLKSSSVVCSEFQITTHILLCLIYSLLQDSWKHKSSRVVNISNHIKCVFFGQSRKHIDENQFLIKQCKQKCLNYILRQQYPKCLKYTE